MSNDSARAPDLGPGLVLATGSALSFGFSGPLARGLIETGWSTGAVVLARIGIAALVVLPFALRALRGRWEILRANAPLLVAFGMGPVAVAQFAYFSAVARMDVAPSLLIEYTAPAAVVVWLWLRRGERPGRLTLAGAALAAVGLLLVLNLLSGANLAVGGVLWALGAMGGAASYFLLSGRVRPGLPPLVLAGAGLVVGALVLGVLGALGILALHTATAQPSYSGGTVAWWLPILGLGLVTAGLAYPLGVEGARRLGSRLASFVGLLEVVAGIVAAWLLLDQVPAALQVAGGLLILTGVVLVRLGERPRRAR